MILQRDTIYQKARTANANKFQLAKCALLASIGAPLCTIKIYLKSSRCIMVKTTERHGEAPLKDDLLLGYTGGLFSLHVG